MVPTHVYLVALKILEDHQREGRGKRMKAHWSKAFQRIACHSHYLSDIQNNTSENARCNVILVQKYLWITSVQWCTLSVTN